LMPPNGTAKLPEENAPININNKPSIVVIFLFTIYSFTIYY